MQIQLNADRVIVQYGDGLGERDGCTIEEISAEAEAAILAEFATPNGGVSVAEDGAVVALPVPAAVTQAASDAAALRQQILDLAQGSVGKLLSALTTGERAALTACLLYKAGGVTQDMKVKPLNEWLK